jgi:hypothetical protein
MLQTPSATAGLREPDTAASLRNEALDNNAIKPPGGAIVMYRSRDLPILHTVECCSAAVANLGDADKEDGLGRKLAAGWSLVDSGFSDCYTARIEYGYDDVDGIWVRRLQRHASRASWAAVVKAAVAVATSRASCASEM